ncbi:hypothetical protein PO587_19255 [Streptomyces gilvifuscus]|uniref:Uncharacterized protein n=1 Tax=Streptomyces gilvifuscus TaxID=1550617 RepID=A0ABT5FVP1_9ACTN|nr:hypothetical protein [Streptomyces gilvifuscus]MDC2956613.1 hypothetical protein [Streptomyces gilvifuscus]
MNRTSVVASRRVASAVATAGVVAVLAWTASTARPDSTTSAGVGTTAVVLADAETTGFAGGTFRPAPGTLPADLRADLRALPTMQPEQRQKAAAKIWRAALAGDYGTRVQLRAEAAQRRFRALPTQLRHDIEELKGLGPAARAEKRTAIRDKALAGGYGERVRHFAERRAAVRQQD